MQHLREHVKEILNNIQQMRRDWDYPTVNQRINFLVDELEAGNKSAFATRIGVKSGVVGDWVKGRLNKPGYDAILKILEAYPSVNTEWFVMGRGERFKAEPTPPTTEPQTFSPYMSAHPADDAGQEQPHRVQPSDNLRVLTVQVAPDGDENIELVPVWAAAGYPLQRVETEYIRKLPSFRLPGTAFNNGSFRAFQVHGASMQGTLEDGDWIICRYVEKWAHDILDNRVYVVVSETDILVKRVLNQINENGRLSLHSDNPTFDVQSMDWQDVREVWQGVARLTLDLTNTRLDLPTEFAKQQALLADMLRRLDKLEENTTL